MKKETVARDNAMFFVVAVGMSLGMEYFAKEVLGSSMEVSQFPTDNVGSPGYIRIDSSSIKTKGDKFWDEFVNKIRNGFLGRISYEFSSATKFKGDLAEHITIEKDGYTFSFHIKQYERDSAHDFEIINPECLDDISEDEQLGRVVYLTISLE